MKIIFIFLIVGFALPQKAFALHQTILPSGEDGLNFVVGMGGLLIMIMITYFIQKIM